jgi:hydroxyethylthiazole kinase-like sugar kinase family protein
MNLPKKVKIVEVGPRDGLQNEQQTIPAQIKIELVDRLTAAGCAIWAVMRSTLPTPLVSLRQTGWHR